jgi:quinol monooxygenase YgiN
MYMRLVRFKLSESGRVKAKAIADDVIPAIKEQPGCLSAVFFSGDDGDSGLCVMWDSEEHANAAAPIMRPRLNEHLQGNTVGDTDARLFAVIAS